MAQVNAGRVRFISRGEYNNSTQYYLFDLVDYNGSSYFAKANTTGNVPTNTTYWQLVAEKGNIGGDGPVGPTGNGIASIIKTASAGLIDTYTITFTNGTTTTFNVTNGQDGDVTQEYVDEENERLKSVFNVLPKVSDSGESVTLNDTGDTMLYKMDLKGNTSQETTTGKNKLDLTGLTTRTISAGITITPNFNGNLLRNIRISGTPTTFSAWQTLKKVTLEAGSYILTGINISDTSKTGLRIGVYIDSSRQYFINANSTTYSFTLAEQTTMDFVVWVQNADYYPSGDIYITPMIRLSSVSDATYEPYTNGASPNPDYPQDVHVVTGDNTIKVEGANLVSSYRNATGTGQFWAALYVKANLKPNAFYEVSFIDNSTGNDYTRNESLAASVSSYSIISNGERQYYSFKTKDNISPDGNGEYLIFKNNKAQSQAPQFTNVDIREVAQLTTESFDYEPYQSASYPVNLGSIELCKIGDYQDYFYKDNGNWYKYGAIGKVVLNGSENWGIRARAYCYSITTIGFINTINDRTIITMISDYTKGITTDQSDTFTTDGIAQINGNRLAWNNYIEQNSNFTDLDTFKNWLNTHNTTVYYVLATPTTTQITDQLLVSQLDELQKAMSYYDKTLITQTNADKPFILDVIGIRDLQDIFNL